MKNRSTHFGGVAALTIGAVCLINAPLSASADAPARLTKQVAEYPESAQRRAIEGWVEIEFLVDAEGKVKNVSVLKSEPTRVFDAAAVKAIRRWEFEPATRDGQPVDSQERRRVVFKL